MARRPGSGTKRAPQTGRSDGQTCDRDRRGRDRGSREGRESGRGGVTDAATGEVLGLEALAERDSDGFTDRLRDFVSGYGVEAMVTDDLSTYKPVVRRLGLDHRICVAHVKKRAWNRPYKIDGWDWVKARIWRLLTELPFDGDLELLRLERAVRDGDATLRRPRVGLSGKWRALLCHRRRGTFRVRTTRRSAR